MVRAISTLGTVAAAAGGLGALVAQGAFFRGEGRVAERMTQRGDYVPPEPPGSREPPSGRGL